MFFNQALKPALVSTVGVLAMAAAGCSWLHHDSRPSPASTTETAPSEAAAPAAAPERELTATEAAVAAGPSAPAAAAPPDNTEQLREAINPNAPKQYTVKRGDTLWGVASVFLRDPWLWPEIWYVNPQIKNPHLIYPGDVLALAYGSNGRPQVSLAQAGPARLAEGLRLEPRLRSTPLDSAIPTIPYSLIASFLSRPTLLPTDIVSHAPHVIAFREDHQAGGTGNAAYVRGVKDAPQGTRYAVMHVSDKLRDPESGHVLGYMGLYTATAAIERPGDPAKAVLIDSQRETLRGDVLVADESGNPFTFVPRAPSNQVRGRIIAVVDDVHMIGQYDIVAINRGKADGVDAGTVLAVDQTGDVVPDRGPGSSQAYSRSDTFAHKVRLPNERAGTVLVFKAYDHMSYALVVGASEFMKVADIVRNP